MAKDKIKINRQEIITTASGAMYVVINDATKKELQNITIDNFRTVIATGIALIERVVAAETNIADFAANSASYTFQEGDIIVITDGGVVTLYMFFGGDATDVANYNRIESSVIEWTNIEDIPSYFLSRVANINTDYVADRNDKYIIADGTLNIVNIELPETSVDLEGKEFVIKAIDITNDVNVYAFENMLYDLASISDEGANTFRYTIDAGSITGLVATNLVKILGCANADNNGIFVVTATDSTTWFEVTNVLGVAEVSSVGTYQQQTFFNTFALAGDVLRLLCNTPLDAYMPV